MATPGEAAARTHHTVAENRASGSQFFAHGAGDLNAAFGNGTQYNDRSDRRTINVHFPGMPSIWPLLQALGSPGGSWDVTTLAIVGWLKRQPDQGPLENCRRQHVEILSQASPNTGKWALASPEYRAWREEATPKTLLMHGILGSGKSLLISLIVDTIQREAKQQDGIACIYLYLQRAEDPPPPSRVWATLLEQLLQQGPIAKEVVSEFNASLQGSSTLHPLEYWRLFAAQASTFRAVYMVLDALDCYPSHGGGAWANMHESLKKLPTNVRLLVSSRVESLSSDIGVGSKLHVQPRAGDIKTFVEGRIKSDPNLRRILATNEDRTAVVERITALTLKSGIFLLARLHLDNLGKCSIPAQVKSTLTRLPADLKLALEASVAQVKHRYADFDRNLAEHALTWVAHAKHGLTIDQVQDSFAMQRSKGKSFRDHRPSRDSVMSACAGLLVLDPENDGLRLLHESMRGYLVSNNMTHKRPDSVIASVCLGCLLADEASPIGQSVLAPYAARYWSSHAGDFVQGAESETNALARALLLDGQKLRRAFKAMDGTQALDVDGMTGLHATVYLNLPRWADSLTKTGSVEMNAKCSDGQTALHWAVRLRRRRILCHLLSKSADANVRDSTGDTPLHLALVTNSTKIVQALVEGGARVDVIGARGVTALSWAIRYGPTAMAGILVKSLADLNVEITKGWTPLRELLSHDAHIKQSADAPADQVATLNKAVKDHVKYLMDMVLERGVDIDRPTSDGWLPLMHAARTGSLWMLRRLLERERRPADVGVRDPHDAESALRAAVFHKNSAAARLLVEHGADVNETNDDGWTPLMQAVKYNDEKLVWFLLDHGARPDTTDHNGWPALLHAVDTRARTIVWLLLVAGRAEVHLHSSKALKLAMAKGDHATAWLLCQHGANADVADEHGTTPLHRASQHGADADVCFLLMNGARGARPDDTGSMPLHYAVRRRLDVMVDVLARQAEHLGLVDRHDDHGNTALTLATLERSAAIMETLLRHKASCDRPNLLGMTPLHYAARCGFNHGLRLLLRDGAQADRLDNKGYSALHHAVSSDEANVETLHLLAAAGADLDLCNGDDLTPLMLAARLGKPSFVRQLLDDNACRSTRNSRNQTALNLAKTKATRNALR